MPVSIRELARMAGVSPSTVSRALSGNPRISQTRRDQIQRLAEEKGYRFPASGAVRGKSFAIGAVIANPLGGLSSDSFFSEVVGGSVGYVKQHGHYLVVETVMGTAPPGSSNDLPRIVKEKRVDGLIVGGIPIEEGYIQSLLGCGLPTVFIGKYLKDPAPCNAVIPDNVSGGQLVGWHLVDCGYDEFYFVGGDISILTFADRLAGFRRALHDRGPGLPDDNVILTNGIDQKAGSQATVQLLPRLRRKGRRIGIFAATDWMAAGVIRVLKAHGLVVPEDVGVAGYSDLELAAHLYPSLTTVRVDRLQLGFLAARTLVDLLNRNMTGPVQIYLQPSLVVRESTRCCETGQEAEVVALEDRVRPSR
ncbi:MAG: LacI family DNA-binding transcriptional regulator [Betaproteobacteria bacterium]